MKKQLLTSLSVLFLGGMMNLAAQNCTGFKTFTPGAWGAPCNGGNAGCYRDAHFAAAFPNGLTIGCNNTLTLTSAAAVQAFFAIRFCTNIAACRCDGRPRRFLQQ